MPLTKQTPRTALLVCLKCKAILSEEAYRYHTDQCILNYDACERCKKTFSSRKNYLQHMKRQHEGTKPEISKEKKAISEASGDREESEDEELGKDPSIELLEEAASKDESGSRTAHEQPAQPHVSVLEGCIVRKRTTPDLHLPRPKSREENKEKRSKFSLECEGNVDLELGRLVGDERKLRAGDVKISVKDGKPKVVFEY